MVRSSMSLSDLLHECIGEKGFTHALMMMLLWPKNGASKSSIKAACETKAGVQA